MKLLVLGNLMVAVELAYSAPRDWASLAILPEDALEAADIPPLNLVSSNRVWKVGDPCFAGGVSAFEVPLSILWR